MIFRTVSAILFYLSSFADGVAHRAAVLPSPVDRHNGVVHSIHDIAVPVFSGDRRYHWCEVLIIMGRVAQRPVDVLRNNQRCSQSSFAVVFRSAPRVAVHEGFNYLREC